MHSINRWIFNSWMDSWVKIKSQVLFFFFIPKLFNKSRVHAVINIINEFSSCAPWKWGKHSLSIFFTLFYFEIKINCRKIVLCIIKSAIFLFKCQRRLCVQLKFLVVVLFSFFFSYFDDWFLNFCFVGLVFFF